ncbi:PD-(D/E)XK motif protein [Peribacillus simplex]|uniref:PD-(D/E)XK motif protein n=1 Tax=Peribacillus simplex TaxID=1478 RepID=UPI00366D2F5B
MEKINLQEIWSEIEQETNCINQSGIIKRLIKPELSYKLFLGVEIESSRRIFLLEAPYKILRNLDPLPQSNGFEAIIRYIGDEEENFLSVVLIVKNNQYNDLFSSLVWDLLENIKSSETNKIVNVIIYRLVMWQKFLNQNKLKSLGEKVQRGLFGELYFLNRLIDYGVNCNYLVDSWGGPEGRIHDFQFEDCAVEIKTSTSKQHQKINISNERQLDNSQINNLYLCHFSLDNQSQTGQSLNQIINQIRDKLLHLPYTLRNFENKLFEFGYIDIHTKYYEKPHYSVREYNRFKIKEGFPRIIEKDLLEGVGDVKYTIMVSGCKNFSIDEDEIVQLIKEYTNE